MEHDSILLRKIDLIDLKMDVILKELILSRSDEKCLVSGMDILLEEVRKRENMGYLENKDERKKCNVINMLTKVNGGGVDPLYIDI